MDEASSRPGLGVQVREVKPGTAGFEVVLALAALVLAQDRYLVSRCSHARESHVLGALDRTRCVGFLRYLIQVIGAEAGRPPVLRNGQPLSEGYVDHLRKVFTKLGIASRTELIRGGLPQHGTG